MSQCKKLNKVANLKEHKLKICKFAALVEGGVDCIFLDFVYYYLLCSSWCFKKDFWENYVKSEYIFSGSLEPG